MLEQWVNICDVTPTLHQCCVLSDIYVCWGVFCKILYFGYFRNGEDDSVLVSFSLVFDNNYTDPDAGLWMGYDIANLIQRQMTQTSTLEEAGIHIDPTYIIITFEPQGKWS